MSIVIVVAIGDLGHLGLGLYHVECTQYKQLTFNRLSVLNNSSFVSIFLNKIQGRYYKSTHGTDL